MVMAESERASGPLATSGLDPTAPPASRLQWLKQRREALQEKLARKNNELKNLCIDEAELTGVLPPEIPLDPGESPPIFRKRVETTFTYPQNVINKLKTNQVEESALELERQVQAGIATAAYAIVNDLSETKSVRRKHRLIYQQSQKRVKDLETRLNFIRQSYSQFSRSSAPVPSDSWPLSPGDDEPDQEGPTKHHKTKKPRPPLEPTDKQSPKLNDKQWQETEINTISGVTQTNDWHRTRSRYIKSDWHSGTLPALNTVDQNENLNLYLYNDQRIRTYSHGNREESTGVPLRNSKTNQIDERSYRKTSDMYALDAETRQKDHWQNKKLMDHKYNSSMYPNQRHHIDPLQYKQQQQHQQFKSKSQQGFYQEQVSRDKSSDVGSIQSLPQYRYPPRPTHSNHLNHPNHLNHSNHNVLSHPMMENQRHQDHEFIHQRKNPETMTRKTRGRKSSESSTWCPEEGVWYPPPVNNHHKDNFGSLDRRKHTIMREPGISREHHLTSQHRLEHVPPPPPPPLPPPPHARMLLRTQSLGSVETWQSGASALPGTGTLRSPGDAERHQMEREKEKEWYETSMDLGYSSQQIAPIQRHYPRSSPSPSSISSSPKLLSPTSPLPPNSPSFNDISVKMSPSTEKDLEIPAETSNHAVKYQPYREVTKPFEMSDFYKYSTKFRKKNEGNQRVELGGKIGNNNSACFVNNNVGVEEIQGSVPSGSYGQGGQRRGYETHMVGRTISRKNEGNREWNNAEDCRVPPKDSTVV